MSTFFFRFLLVTLCSCQRVPPRPAGDAVSGPGTTTIPLYRAYEDGARIYVEADLGDGVPRFFLVDTGASVTTVSQEVADELGLEVEERGNWLRGLAGMVRWKESVLPTVQLGRVTIPNVNVAVDVPGVPTAAGAVPIVGLMGNNVWQHFTLAIDYPAGVMELHQPGTLPLPDSAQPVSFDGQHIIAPATLEVPVEGGEPMEQVIVFTVDTGASGLLLSGGSARGLEPVATHGVELIFGVGRGDDLPASNFLHQTRRLPVEAVSIGGARVEEQFTATWLEDDRQLGNLIGHHALDRHRVLIDYKAQRLALTESTLPAAQPNLHDRYGSWLKRRRNGPRDILLDRVAVLMYQEELDQAASLLKQHLRANEDDAQAAIVLARLIRHMGDPDRAIETLRSLPIADLVEHGALISLVNSLWLEGHHDKALALAEDAVAQHPDSAIAWLALSDAQRAGGDLNAARIALRQVNTIDQNPDGHLLRRSWIASEEGDEYAAITHIRRLIELYPNGAVAPWFYALLVRDTRNTALFLEDIGRARARLHPGDGPLDFFAGAYYVVGMPEEAESLMRSGMSRDCSQMSNPDSQRNCEAWYHALTRQNLEQAFDRVQTAVTNHPNRSDYLDTLAVVHEAQGDLQAARDAAWQAATLAPDDVYFLWQAARLDREASSL